MRDVHVRAIVWAAVAIALTIAAVVAGVFLMLRWSHVPPGGARIPDELQRGAPQMWIAPQRALDQHPGAQLPLDIPATADDGAAHRLADYFGGDRPVLLVPSYYRCAQLCGLVMQGLIASLKRSGASNWQVVAFSIDPRDTPRDAHARRDADLAYASFAGLANPRLRLLTLAPGDVQRLAGTIGLRWQDAGGEIAHPVTVVVVTPRGVVSRYFNGIGFDANELRVALADAAGDRIGAITSRLALLCSHWEPRGGVHDAAVMDAVRALSLAIVLALAAWVWRMR